MPRLKNHSHTEVQSTTRIRAALRVGFGVFLTGALLFSLLVLKVREPGTPEPVNTSTVTMVTATPTLENAGIEVVVAGDANHNAAPALYYQEAGQTIWKIGHPFVRSAESTVWRTSVFAIRPGTTYQYAVVVNDPDGAVPAFTTGTFSTKAEPTTVAPLRTLYVGPTGNDANPGTNSLAPLRTIQRAATLSRPGDRILVSPGTYRERVSVTTAGTAAQPIIFESAAHATLPGSTPAVLDGALESLAQIDATNNWLPDPAGAFGVYYTTLSSFSAADDPIALYAGVEKLYAYYNYPYNQTSNYANFIARRFCPEGGTTCHTTTAAGGYWYDKPTKRLYVKLPSGLDPDLTTLSVGRRNTFGFDLRGVSHVTVRGFDIRHFHVGVYLQGENGRGSMQNVIEKNRLNYNTFGVQLGVRDSLVAHNIVQDNEAFDSKVHEWRWEDVKLNDVESTGVSASGGAANVIRRNNVKNLFNGIDLTVSAATLTHLNANTDVSQNIVTDMGDDPIELDGPSANVRAVQNVIRRAVRPTAGESGFSVAPIMSGPAWLVRNSILDTRQSALKFGYGVEAPVGPVRLYHNTIASGVADLFAVIRFVDQGSAVGANVTARNNLFVAHGTEGAGNGEGFVFEDTYAAHQQPRLLLDFDYNNYANVRTCSTAPCPLTSWQRTRYTSFNMFRSVSGQETHGVSFDPLFVNLTAGNLALQAASPVLNRGVVLPGINDSYTGTAPDLGALER